MAVPAKSLLLMLKLVYVTLPRWWLLSVNSLTLMELDTSEPGTSIIVGGEKGHCARARRISQDSLSFEERERINRMRVDEALIFGEPELLHVDPELYELLAPERSRQRAETIKAMHCVCDLIYN